MARTFFRIVRQNSPVLDDFKSHKALGRPLRDPTMEREWSEDVSVYDSMTSLTTHWPECVLLASASAGLSSR